MTNADYYGNQPPAGGFGYVFPFTPTTQPVAWFLTRKMCRVTLTP